MFLYLKWHLWETKLIACSSFSGCVPNCKDDPQGAAYFQDKHICNIFYQCSNGDMILQNCSNETSWSHSECICVHFNYDICDKKTFRFFQPAMSFAKCTKMTWVLHWFIFIFNNQESSYYITVIQPKVLIVLRSNIISNKCPAFGVTFQVNTTEGIAWTINELDLIGRQCESLLQKSIDYLTLISIMLLLYLGFDQYRYTPNILWLLTHIKKIEIKTHICIPVSYQCCFHI